MCIIWHESLYHLGTKSRNAPGSQEDTRLFSCIWASIENNAQNMTVRTIDGVAQENSEHVYWENIHDHTCRDIYKDRPTCPDCDGYETLVDLRDIWPNSYSPGERIIGDIETLELMVVRGVRIDMPTYNENQGVINSGRPWDGR